jgi:hypothetical protein
MPSALKTCLECSRQCFATSTRVPQSNQIEVKKTAQIRVLKDTNSSPCDSDRGAKRNKTRLSGTKNRNCGGSLGNVS